MTTTIQLSDKGGETGQAILLVKVEAPDDVSPDAVWNHFVNLAVEAGLGGTIDTFDALLKAKRVAEAGLGATEVPAQFAPPPPATVVAGPWGQPPVAPYQPPQLPAAAAPAAAATGAPSCYHGVKEYISGITKSGKNQGSRWQAWACPADRNDPTKCEKEWIRD